MLKKTNNIIFIFILCIITTSLIGAFIIEYVLGYQPCKLCIYERVPYFVSIFLILEILFFKKKYKVYFIVNFYNFFS